MTTHEKLMKRLSSYGKVGKGLKLTPGSPSFKKEAERLKQKGVVEFRGGRVYLTKRTKK
ncbi:MAG: hypothetical protein NTZ35_01280 [Ignavibacteriales bacterium]|nr:hypothetical protein [Ignavibacteriales bacterium]